MHVTVLKCPWGNQYSISNALRLLDLPHAIQTIEHALSDSDVLIIPGVGNFKHAIGYLNTSAEALRLEEYVDDGRMVIGICLGMQLLFSSSQEGPSKGLNIIQGSVQSFEGVGKKIINTGWASTTRNDTSNYKSCYYFTHGYYCMPVDQMVITRHAVFRGTTFAASVRQGNVFGFQFHPEKSGKNGLNLLKEVLYS